ncbi:MAG TPA: hypothetical protein VH640_12790 [Bryobacteraceae bacterium]
MTKAHIAAAAILITPWMLHADFVPGPGDTYVEQGTMSPSFTTGPGCPGGNCVLGYDYQVYVDPSGDVNFLFSDYSTPVNWTGTDFTSLLPALPEGDAYTTATVTFAFEPSPYPNYSAVFGGASIGDGCTWASGTISSSKTTAEAILQIPAMLCNPNFVIQAEGSSAIVPNWPSPSLPPGYYSDTEFYSPPTIDYTVTLNYADPVPEPSYLAAIGLGLVTLVCFRNRER